MAADPQADRRGLRGEDEVGGLHEDQKQLALVDGLGGEVQGRGKVTAVAMQVAHELHRFLESQVGLAQLARFQLMEM